MMQNSSLIDLNSSFPKRPWSEINSVIMTYASVVKTNSDFFDLYGTFAEGVLTETLCGGLRLVYPLYDQNLRFSLLYVWPDQKLDELEGKNYTLFMTKMAKIDTVEPRHSTTLLIPPPRFYGHFILTRKKLSQSFSYLKNPFNTTIPLIRLVFHGPKVVVLTAFHCNWNLLLGHLNAAQIEVPTSFLSIALHIPTAQDFCVMIACTYTAFNFPQAIFRQQNKCSFFLNKHGDPYCIMLVNKLSAFILKTKEKTCSEEKKI